MTYNKNQMMLVWENFTVDDSIYFPKFRIDDYFTSSICDREPVRRSCIRGIVRMSRKVSFYVTRYYAPTLLVTTAAFISYWMPAGEIGPRVVVNITPFLTLVTLHNALNNEISVSYVVALHIWMFACMFYTFMGLVVLFISMRCHAAEKSRREARDKRRMIEDSDCLFHKLSSRLIDSSVTGVHVSTADAAVISASAAVSLNAASPAESRRRGSSHVEQESRGTAWLADRGSCLPDARNFISRSFARCKNMMQGLALGQSISGDAGGGVGSTTVRGGECEYVTPADRVARVLAPTTFAVFAVAYFALFCSFTDDHGSIDGFSR